MLGRGAMTGDSGNKAPSSPLREQRERLRTKTFLRTKLDEVQAKKSEGGVDFAYVDGIIGELNKHADGIKHAPEMAVDGQILAELSSIVLEDAQKRRAGYSAIDSQTLTKAIRNFVLKNTVDAQDSHGDDVLETVDLSALGAIAMKRFKLNVNKVNFMLGPVSYIPEKKTAKPRPAKQRIDEKDKVKPLQGAEAQLQAEEVTTARVSKLYNIIKAQGDTTICLFKFAVHPTSFAETVENFFHLAFLVKQGLVEIYVDDSGLPVIARALAPESEESTVAVKKQLIMGLDMTEYEAIVEAFHITEPYIEMEIARLENEDEEEEEEEEESSEDEPPTGKRARR